MYLGGLPFCLICDASSCCPVNVDACFRENNSLLFKIRGNTTGVDVDTVLSAHLPGEFKAIGRSSIIFARTVIDYQLSMLLD